jgi:hypothetical protein
MRAVEPSLDARLEIREPPWPAGGSARWVLAR